MTLSLTMDNFNATLPLLPPETIMQVIEGGNHAQFGNYGTAAGGWDCDHLRV